MTDIEHKRDDFGGRAILHLEIDGQPVIVGSSDPSHGNIAISPSHGAIEITVGNRTLSIECEAFVDDKSNAI